VGATVTDGRRTYRTPSGSTPHVSIAAQNLEKQIFAAVLDRFDNASLKPGPPAAGSAAAAQVERIEAELAEWAELRGTDQISLSEYTAGRKPMVARLEEARAALPRVMPTDRRLERPGVLRADWPTMDTHERRHVLRLVINRIIVKPAVTQGSREVAPRLDIQWKF
jgi:hypothetical protein